MVAALLTCIVTAYTAHDAGMDGRGITASGARVVDGITAAADWSHHPPGARVWIAGLGWRTIQDAGGGVRGAGRIDVYMPFRSRALQWGRRDVACQWWHAGHTRGAY